MELSAVFLRHLPAGRDRPAASPALEAALAAAVDAGRATWPEVALAPDRFVRHLAERLPEDVDPLAAVAALHAGDLHLACACADGDAAALAVFEGRFLSEVGAYLSRADALPAFSQEVKAILRQRLLVAEEGVLPRIGQYTGSGPLGGWLRIATTRLAVDLRRAETAQGAREREAALPAAPPDPELDYLKTRYRAELEEAFRATVAALPPREANVLGLHYLEGMTVDAIAALYAVSPRTVHRRIAEARAHVLEETRRLLGERLRASPGELDSLIRLAQSQLDITLSRFLGKPEE